ncbi:MAG: prolipoprotein diacylglyceryl transferase, partial [Anaerolineae bacterium]|nr:prolipoprotein diacylglyceryl transferase [Anaerolineae bacterium]
VLAYLAKKRADRLRDGDIFVGYIVGYSLGRSWIEFFRPDAWMIGPLAAAQWFGLALALAGIALLVLRRRIAPQPSPAMSDVEQGRESSE